MKLLKEQDDAEWDRMQAEYANDNSDDEDEEEDFAWYDINDKDTYFVLTTMTKTVYK
jgi:hypothetical protein